MGEGNDLFQVKIFVKCIYPSECTLVSLFSNRPARFYVLRIVERTLKCLVRRVPVQFVHTSRVFHSFVRAVSFFCRLIFRGAEHMKHRVTKNVPNFP